MTTVKPLQSLPPAPQESKCGSANPSTKPGQLHTAWQAFDELRAVLRLSNAELPSADPTTPRQMPLPALWS